jgi:hypothetical protein
VALGGPRARVGSVQVRGDEVVEAVAGPRLVRAADPADRDERAEGPERRGRAVEGAVDLVAPADVAGSDVRLRAELGRRRREPLLVSPEEGQSRALAREPERDRAADSRSGPGDDDVLSGEAGDRRSLTGAGRASDAVPTGFPTPGNPVRRPVAADVVQPPAGMLEPCVAAVVPLGALFKRPRVDRWRRSRQASTEAGVASLDWNPAERTPASLSPRRTGVLGS